jgi:diguanylate cyclase (GGDEF)-like protein
MGHSGAQACAHLGSGIERSLLSLGERVSAEPSAALLRQTREQVEQELRQWGESAAEYFKSKAGEVRELMMALARTAESVGERDQKYNRQLSAFRSRLQAIADLEDLSKIRSSLLQSAHELKTCVDKMAQESEQSVAELRKEVGRYQTQLQEAERLATLDPLTGLGNRRKVELELEARMGKTSPVSVVIFDVNGFKEINDQLGHLAGDQILKQFATELRSVVRASDVVGRWGGDEFLVILDCDLERAKSQMQRIREWVFGEYSVSMPGGARKVSVSASVGVAERQAGETAVEVVGRADAAMYREKNRRAPIPATSAERRPSR